MLSKSTAVIFSFFVFVCLGSCNEAIQLQKKEPGEAKNFNDLKNDPMNFTLICELVIRVAKGIGSDDNITLIGFKF